MSNPFENGTEQVAAFQKIWLDTATKMMQMPFSASPNTPPPDILKQMRSGIFQALGQSWEEYMRSPAFMEGAKQWMDNMMAFRKMSNDMMARLRNEMQAPSRDDIDTVMLNVRHMEKRLLDRLDEMADQIQELKERLGKQPAPKPTASRRRPATRTAARTRSTSTP